MRRILSLICVFCSACGGSLIQSTDELPLPPENKGYLQLICQPADTEVYVDDVFRGYLDGYIDGVLLLPAGKHRLKLQKAGYYSQYLQIELGDQAVVLERQLIRQPDPIEP